MIWDRPTVTMDH